MTTNKLVLSVGQYSQKGVGKETNQDFYGVCTPTGPQLTTKGIAAALADGISTSDVAHIASETAIKTFLSDYFCTSDAWSVRKSVQRVLMATNSWLHSQTRRSPYRYDMDRGYVCTLSALVIKSTTAHLFHIGDARIYHGRQGSVEQLTDDHRLWLSADKHHLSRALGVYQQIEIDYRTLAVKPGDVFILATDGVHEFVEGDRMLALASADHLQAAAEAIVTEAAQAGSTDDLTIQIVRIETLPDPDQQDHQQRAKTLPVPPVLEAGRTFEGYAIIRELHAGSRSHVYLATDNASGETLVLKAPTLELGQDPVLLEQFLTEEWIARRIASPHILKPVRQTRPQHHLYMVTEFIDGQTLTQWMRDNPKPALEKVRAIIGQIASGLRAFHRQEVCHQDLRPDNVLIDHTGTVKLIDFGSAKVAGITEYTAPTGRESLLGTAQYSAPECFLGEDPSESADLFSLGVITYQMLTGNLPYGAQVARCKSRSALNRLQYTSVRGARPDLPIWIDAVLRKALHPNAHKRHGDVSEFVFDLRHPGRDHMNVAKLPLAARNPERFWKSVSLVLTLTVAGLLVALLH